MPIDPIDLFPLPLILALSALFLLALAYDLRAHRHRKHSQETIYRCDRCQRVYTATRQTPTASCPGCGKQNPAVRPR